MLTIRGCHTSQELTEEGMTFQPKINRRSSVLAVQNQVQDSITPEGALRRSTVSERLYQKAFSSTQQRRGDLLHQDQECTFVPAINGRSRDLLRRSGEIPAGFMERQVVCVQGKDNWQLMGPCMPSTWAARLL